MSGRRLDDYQFMQIWQSSSDVDEVINRTGHFYSSVIQRARKMRRAGFDLKKFPRLTKTGEIPGDGIMTWLKTNYPQVYEEWKTTERR